MLASVCKALRLAWPGLAAGLLATSTAVDGAGQANQATAAHAPAVPTSAVPASAAPKPKPPLDDGRDPLDIVRERLAAKLGAVKAPDAASPNVLRVVSKASTAPDRPASADAGRRPTSGAATGGGSLAAMRPGHGGVEPSSGFALAARGSRPGGLSSTAPHSAGHGAGDHWSYAGTGGPDAWGRLDAGFAACSSGSRQSPIDIRDGIRVDLDPVQFDYKPSAFRVVDTGHTVQVNLAPGNSIEVSGRRYELLQFHFHRPSEERVDGRLFDMVAHLVHKDADGRLAVIAVLLDRGSAQPVVQAVWNNLPLEKGDEVAARLPLDLNALLPADRGYYTYMGSLTTPPCSEGVLWVVMKQPVPIAPEQIAIFTRLYPMNARPVQSAGGRLVKQSN